MKSTWRKEKSGNAKFKMKERNLNFFQNINKRRKKRSSIKSRNADDDNNKKNEFEKKDIYLYI